MVRSIVAGGLGEPYGKPTSIPQGDPMSMVITSLLLRAWVVQMKEMEVKPRILVDDLQLRCTGGNHLDYPQAPRGPGGEISTEEIHHVVFMCNFEKLAYRA